MARGVDPGGTKVARKMSPENVTHKCIEKVAELTTRMLGGSVKKITEDVKDAPYHDNRDRAVQRSAHWDHEKALEERLLPRHGEQDLLYRRREEPKTERHRAGVATRAEPSRCMGGVITGAAGKVVPGGACTT